MSKTEDDARSDGDEHASGKQHAHDKPKNQDEDDKDGDDDEGSDKQGDKDKKKPHSRLPLIIGAIVVVIVIILGILYWLTTRNELTTTDAYTDGTAISIAANVSGYATQLYVTDNSYVHAGQLLVTIDPRTDQASLRAAQADLVLSRSALATAKINLREQRISVPAKLQQARAQLFQARAQELLAARNYNREVGADRRATAATTIDQGYEQLQVARASVMTAKAQLASAALVPERLAQAVQAVQQKHAQLLQAEARLAQAQVKLSYNEIRAPQAGFITMRNVDLGTYIQTGQQLFYIVTSHPWIVANLKETELARIRPGLLVHIRVDAFPRLKLRGHVQSVQMGSGAKFSAFPAENATGNFVKIVRRVPVKILLDRGMLRGRSLPLGISVTPTIELGHPRHGAFR